jgi:CRISPR/Cas system CMR-associated protein Cmr3 (group 5 of RAMP superfamily)
MYTAVVSVGLLDIHKILSYKVGALTTTNCEGIIFLIPSVNLQHPRYRTGGIFYSFLTCIDSVSMQGKPIPYVILKGSVYYVRFSENIENIITVIFCGLQYCTQLKC